MHHAAQMLHKDSLVDLKLWCPQRLPGRIHSSCCSNPAELSHVLNIFRGDRSPYIDILAPKGSRNEGNWSNVKFVPNVSRGLRNEKCASRRGFVEYLYRIESVGKSSWPLLLLFSSKHVLRSVERRVENNGVKQSSPAFPERC